MTLDSQVTCTNKMAVSASPRTNTASAGSGLSFSISRLLEKASANDNSASAHPPEMKPSAAVKNNPKVAAAELLLGKESPPESPLEVDDEAPEDSDVDDDEDVKVNDSGDEESAGSRPDDSKMPDYSSHPPHPSMGIDWYALYALQQQQQQQQHHHGMIPSHLMQHHNSGAFANSRGGPSGMLNMSAGTYLSYPSTPGSTGTNAGSGGAPSGPGGYPGPPPPHGLSSSSQHSPLSPASLHHHHMSGGLNPAGIPNAFAALLEATVFKDRLAAGKKIPASNNHQRLGGEFVSPVFSARDLKRINFSEMKLSFRTTRMINRAATVPRPPTLHTLGASNKKKKSVADAKLFMISS